MLIATTSPLLWYLTRVSGLAALVMLGAVALLGIAVAGKILPSGVARFLGPDLHRRLSLTLVVVLAIHILTALADSFVPIGWTAAVIPFLSHYRRAFVGFGTLAFDGLLIVIASSLARQHLGFALWKRTHMLVWLVLALAIVHGLGTGSDTRLAAVLAVYGAITAGVIVLAVLRIRRDPDLAHTARTLGMVGVLGVPGVVALWARSGPLRPGWSARIDGTAPTTATTAAVTRSSEPLGGPITATVTQTQATSATDLTIAGAIGGTNERLTVVLTGQPSEGVFAVSGGTVTLGTPSAPNLCHGSVTALGGSTISFSLACPHATVEGTAALAIDANGATGQVSFSTAPSEALNAAPSIGAPEADGSEGSDA
ncbi:hypothetical protein Afer_0999 [Acidimicrobium ferrooxidans DSM 10331]|uniref:Ferric oxidoreductase domain-containing protein n=1 Tax=Acidimicrobium ferrooxidans (strain DSM 10331 / JCM 15462 / NBRC 103882 / ICP) TaxID=525909 RepID=C7LYX9_ACIFD|nr:ferric reductase-like transmembrane domain-containing protein [Acidimicrobium ferrooxidans]ACU53937.1 hypothetical protein Afer_0999 [Acidimicrobium ferrooxidans DSM 10331]